MEGRLTVYFEDPFWIGIFERVIDGELSVCKVTFGAEPNDNELLDFILKHYYELKFSPGVAAEIRQFSSNPKRRQREIRKDMTRTGTGTKAQQALQMQREELKTERQQIRKEQKEAELKRQFELDQQKRKEKRKGH